MSSPIFYFDVASPNAYLAYRVLPAVEARTGAPFEFRPVLLGGLFKLSGNQSPMTAFAGVPKKLAYERREMERFAERHGLHAFAMNPHFPVNTLQAMRVLTAAAASADLPAATGALFRAMWERGLKLDDPEVLRAVLEEAGLPAESLLAAAAGAEVKARLAAETEAAYDVGAFGLPSFRVGGELYFGKDRLPDVEAAILATDPALRTPASPAA